MQTNGIMAEGIKLHYLGQEEQGKIIHGKSDNRNGEFITLHATQYGN